MARSLTCFAVLLALSTCTLVGCVTPVQIASTRRTPASTTVTGPPVAPAPTAVLMPTFGPPECRQRNPAIDPLEYERLLYGDSACKLLSISPSGEYLAYVTLTPPADGEVGYGVEVVKLKQRGTTEGYPIYEMEPYFPIHYLQWSASNQLVFGGGYEGGHTVVYDPAGMKVLADLVGPMVASPFFWNPARTAYFYNLEGLFGADVCMSILYGFDFATGQEFPDVYEFLGVEDEYDNPHAAINALSLRMVGWSRDGQRLYLTVMPLQWREDAFAYETRPQQRLFGANARPGYSELQTPTGEIKAAILADADFAAYRKQVDTAFERWRTGNLPWLRGIAAGSRPKELIERLAEDLLRAFADVPLIDKYDVYQRLMTYWTETMQDDVYLLAADGWQASEELIPPPLVITRTFAAEQQAIDALEAAHEAIGQQMAALDEEQGGEGGLLEEVKNDKGKITRAAVKARLKEIAGDAETTDERAALGEYLGLLDQEAETARQIREAQKALAAKVAAKYKALSEDEVKALVVDDKWLAALAGDMQTELDRISQGLSGRVKELAERYAAPLPQLDADVDVLSAKVQAHLERMGFTP